MFDQNDVQKIHVGSDKLNEKAKEIKKTIAILAGLLAKFPVAEGHGKEVQLCKVDKTWYFLKTHRWIDPNSESGAAVHLYSQTEGESAQSLTDLPLEAIEPLYERQGVIIEQIALREPRIRPALELLKAAGTKS